MAGFNGMKLPIFLRAFWRGWRALAVKLGYFNGLVLLTIFYWIVIALVGALFGLFRQDPLLRRPRAGSTYHPKQLGPRPLGEYEHLY
jgi:hypothetical protein